MVAAVDAAHAVGYATGQTGCDEGAAAAVGAPPGSLTVSVYFGTEADARAAQAAFDERGVSSTVALVRTVLPRLGLVGRDGGAAGRGRR